MADFYEIDFLAVETAKSGDAITMQYEVGGLSYIHVVDGGFQSTGEKVVAHIKNYYKSQPYIDHVIVTHPDGDHAGGLRDVLENFTVLNLWMLRPWLYADEIIDRFETYSSVDALKRRLKQIYSNLAALEEIAEAKAINIHAPFQGSRIGHFTVLSPSKSRYLDLIVSSERTPESVEEAKKASLSPLDALFEAAAKVKNFIKGAWGDEVFSINETSAENEMSVVQYAYLSGHKILLTGDAGRTALRDAIAFAPYADLVLPGLNVVQVPHHGSRRNVSSDILDSLLGQKLGTQPAEGTGKFSAYISSAKADPHHPRKVVERAFRHRGANIFKTEGANQYAFKNLPIRSGWSPSSPSPYPDEYEA